MRESKFRTVIWVTAGLCWVLQFLAVMLLPDEAATAIVFVAIAIALNCVLAWWLLPRRFLAAQVLWHLGLTLIITAIVLLISDRFLPGMEVSGFVGAIVAAIAMAVVAWIIAWLLGLLGLA